MDARQQLKAAAGLGSSREVFTGRLQAQPWPTIWRDGRFAPLPELVALRPHAAAEAEAGAWPPTAMASSKLQVSQHVCCNPCLSGQVLVSPTQLTHVCWANLCPWCQPS